MMSLRGRKSQIFVLGDKEDAESDGDGDGDYALRRKRMSH